MIRLEPVILVEGKYDKIKLSQIFDATILTTDGFGIFKHKDKVALLRRLAAARGLLVFTDSDGAGFVIRNFLKGALTEGRVYHAYIPDLYGKQKARRMASWAWRVFRTRCSSATWSKAGLCNAEQRKKAGSPRLICTKWAFPAERTAPVSAGGCCRRWICRSISVQMPCWMY